MKKPRRTRVSQTHRVDGNNIDWARDGVAWPTAGAIRAALADVPDHAYVSIRTHDWGWPRWSYTIFAWWNRHQPQTEEDRLEARQEFLLQKVRGEA